MKTDLKAFYLLRREFARERQKSFRQSRDRKGVVAAHTAYAGFRQLFAARFPRQLH